MVSLPTCPACSQSDPVPAILDLQGVPTTDTNGNSVSASLTTVDLQRILNLFNSVTQNSSGGGGVTGTIEPEDDDDDPDYVDEEDGDDDDGTNYTYGFGSGPRGRAWIRSHWWPELTEPQKEGLELLFGGEFGRILHQRNSREGRKNVAQSLLNRGMNARPMYKEDIAGVSAIVPATNGIRLMSSRMSSQTRVEPPWHRMPQMHMSDSSRPVRPLGYIQGTI